jgi:hypothetical protein
MRLAMGRSGRIQRLPLLLLLVVLISAGVSGKPQQGAGAGEESPEGDYADNYDEYNPVDYEPEYEEGTSILPSPAPLSSFVRSTSFNHLKIVDKKKLYPINAIVTSKKVRLSQSCTESVRTTCPCPLSARSRWVISLLWRWRRKKKRTRFKSSPVCLATRRCCIANPIMSPFTLEGK